MIQEIKNPLLTDHLITEGDLSIFLGISLPNIQRMRSRGTGPRFVQLSERRIAYRLSDVERWLAARTTDRVRGIDVRPRSTDEVSRGTAA